MKQGQGQNRVRQPLSVHLRRPRLACWSAGLWGSFTASVCTSFFVTRYRFMSSSTIHATSLRSPLPNAIQLSVASICHSFDFRRLQAGAPCAGQIKCFVHDRGAKASIEPACIVTSALFASPARIGTERGAHALLDILWLCMRPVIAD